MSMCDTCAQPGACCRDIPIFGSAGWGNFYPMDWPMRAESELERMMPAHPFIPLRLEMYPEKEYGAGRWSCTNLTPEGRCGDYENRPALCKAYEPASDRLCVMYVPPLATEEIPC